jgi:hypothetical protein
MRRFHVRTLLTGHPYRRDVCLWDVATGRPSGRLRGHEGEIHSLASSPNGRYLASGGDDRTILIWDLSRAIGPSQPVKDRLSEEELQRFWAELAEADPICARAAVRALAAAPRDALPFLRRRLQPARAPSAKELAALIEQLGGADFATREKAYRRLAHLGETAESGLRRARANKPDFELHQRIGRLLEMCDNPALSADRWRDQRAIEVLERIGDRSARAVLEALARGVPEARLTFESKAALRRLRR